MSKTKLNYVVDMLSLLAFLAVGLSGIALLLVPGGRGAGQNLILGVPRAGWIELHDWAGISLMLGVCLHFLLHWKWVVCTTGNLLRDLAPRATGAECPAAFEADQQLL